MRYYELKEQISEIIFNTCNIKTSAEVKVIFEQYEKENQDDEEITEENIKRVGEKFRSWNATAFYKELDTLKKNQAYHEGERGDMKADIEILRKMQGQHIKEIESMRKEIDTIKKTVNKIYNSNDFEKPKQERFTITKDNPFTILENNEFYMSFKVASDAILIRDKLNKLNAMEGGGK